MEKSSKKEKKVSTIDTGNLCLERFEVQGPTGLWSRVLARVLVRMTGWRSPRCVLHWKIKETKLKRLYFKLLAVQGKEGTEGACLLPTALAWDGHRNGEIVISHSKIRASGKRYSASLADLARSGLLPTPTTGSNRNSRNAIQRIGAAHQNHGVSLGLAQVIEIATGTLPKEFDSWDQVSLFYRRLLPVPLARDLFERRKSRSNPCIDPAITGMLPTPTAGVNETCNMGKAAMEKRIRDGRQEDLNMKLYKITGQTGKLNPLFIMEMMGFPCRWTLIPFLKPTF